MKIVALHICPAHVYFGHHGVEAGPEPMNEVAEIVCRAGRGVEGDRFFDYKPDYKGQITFFESETHAALMVALGLENVSYAINRRNVTTCGVELKTLIGVEFEVQGIRFLGSEECRPCYWMDSAYQPGAEEFLKGRGGLRARILTDGRLTRTR